MENKIILISSLFLLAFILMAGTSNNESVLEGSWEFSVDDAPWEYSRGVLIFETNDDLELTGKVEFDNGRVIQISNISLDGDKVVFEVSVDGNDVKTDFTLSENEMSGYVHTVDGNLFFSAKRVEIVTE